MNLFERNITIFDLETKKSPAETGWTNYKEMGISVGCAYNFKTQDFTTYFDDGFKDLAKLLQESELISGFNIEGFDLRLLAGVLNQSLDVEIYDVLKESRKFVGNKFAKGLKLDDHLEATFGKSSMKTAHGSMAPQMFQRGLMSELTSYCLADVKREAMLFKHVWDHGWASTPMHGQMHLAKPQSFLKIGSLGEDQLNFPKI